MDTPHPRVPPEWEDWLSQATTPRCSAQRRGRVLLISYQFPPVGGSGVQRPAKLARYLLEFGWELEVLTADHERFPWRDATLLEDFPDACKVHRFSGFEPACVARRAVSCLRFRGPACAWIEDRLYWRLAGWAARRGKGNGESWWVRPAISAARALHRRNAFDAVISTGPPHFVHAVALALARTSSIAWVADLRDPLLSDFDRTRASAAHEQTQRRFERLILRHADAITTTCESFAEHLQARYPARAASIRCITNGFDRNDLRSGLAVAAQIGHSLPPMPANNAAQPRVTLLASGSFYGRREVQRVLQPLADVMARRPEWSGRVRLHLVGTIDARQRRELERARPDWLVLDGYLQHREAVALALRADCSLVLVPECQHGRLSIPAKTFELIATPRHVLGLVPPGSETAQVLEQAGACTLAPLDDPVRVGLAFEQVISAHFAGTLPASRNWPELGRYDRRHIAGQFAALLDELRATAAVNPFHSCDAGDRGAELCLARTSPATRRPCAVQPADLDLDSLEVS